MKTLIQNKYFTLLLVALLVISLSFAFVSCNKEQTGDEPAGGETPGAGEGQAPGGGGNDSTDSGESGVKPPSLVGITLKGETYTYDGEEKSLAVSGNLPDGITVSYEENGKTDAGEYTVRAKFYFNGDYVDGADLTAKLNIERATFDTAGKFKNRSVNFNGEPQSIELSEQLPAGLSVSYEGNGVRSIGVHTVKAVFSGDEKNVIVPEPITATLMIVRGSYASEGLQYTLVDGKEYKVTGYTGDKDFAVVPPKYNELPVTSIASNAFGGNAALAYVWLPASVTNIGNKAFADCTSLTELVIGSNVEVIGSQAFASVPMKEWVLPDTLTVIGQGAFKGTALESITLPFIGGSRNSSNAYLGYIFGGANAQYVPGSLETVVLSAQCEEIPAYAFKDCSKLSTVTLGAGVKAIGNGAFAGCASLRSIYLPQAVAEIASDAQWYDSPFINCADDLMIVMQGDMNPDFGKFWCRLNETKGALVIYMKEYDDYLKNGESYRNVDLSDARLAAIYVDGAKINGFSTTKADYSVDFDVNYGYKKVNAKVYSAAATLSIEQASRANGGVATVTVTSGDGSVQRQYSVVFSESGILKTSEAIVNKNGAEATVTFVIDDGNTQTGGYALEFLNKYSSYLNISFAIPTRHFATLATKTNDDGTVEYVMSTDGKYTYTVNEDFYNFWKTVMATGQAEIVNHSHTHLYWGIDDAGGVTEYVNSKGEVKVSTVQPIGSSTKEIYASKQIIEDLFPKLMYPEQRSLGFIVPGISVKTSDVTIDGVTYKTYNTYFNRLLKTAIENGELIGARGTFQVNDTVSSRSKVILPSMLDTVNKRMGTNAYMIVNANKGATGIENWTAFIDHAIDQNGWACFCIHEIRPTETNAHFILKDDADALFGYVADKNVWVASYTDAMLYYCEWSTAELDAEYADGRVKVTLTDAERDDIFNMKLTVKVNIPGTWETAALGGNAIEVHENGDGTKFVYVDVLPDGGAVEITEK